jgi:hypothetical protein
MTSYITVEHCRLFGCNHSAIRVETSGDHTSLVENRIESSACGVLVSQSKDVLVQGVEITDCPTGILVYLPSTTETTPLLIERCRIQKCQMGINLNQAKWTLVNETWFEKNELGISEMAPALAGMYFWRNNFLWNTIHAQQSITGMNWSRGGIGNFWSDYTGTDSNGDGIGDTPYTVTPTQQDPYPRIKPLDFEDPSAEAGSDITVRQHSSFTLDGMASMDDTWISEWTWTINIPGTPLILHGSKVDSVVDIAGAFDVVLVVTDAVGKTASDMLKLFVTDGDPPNFLAIDVPTTIGTGGTLNISCRVHDNVAVVAVTVNYFYGTGSIRLGDLMALDDETWSLEVPVPSDSVEPIYYILTAKDAKNNKNSTGYLSVQVVDDDPPQLIPDMPTHVTTGDDASIRCTAFDNVGLSNVTVDYQFNGSKPAMVNLTVSGQIRFTTIQVPPNATSPLSVLFTATDLSGNMVTVGPLIVRVDDNDPPTMVGNWTEPSIDAWRKGANVMLEAAFEDNIGVVTVHVERRYTATDWEAIPMSLDGNTYAATLVIATDLGDRLWFRFNATDGAGNSLVTSQQEVRLLSQNPRIASTPETRIEEDCQYNLTLSAEDPDTDLSWLRWSMDTNATWLHLDAVTGLLTGVPRAEDIGSYHVNVTVEDGSGGKDWILFDIEVFDVNYPPNVTIDTPVSGALAKGRLIVSGRATDDDDRIVWVRLQVDGGEWVQTIGNSSWSFELVTENLGAGNHTITVVAYDGVSQSEQRTVVFILQKNENGQWHPDILILLLVCLPIVALLMWILVRRMKKGDNQS